MCRSYIIICCESNNTLVWYMSQKQFKHFWRKCREKFMHFVRKVFAQKILPTGKLGLCRPLGVSLGPFCPQTMGFGGPEPPKNDLFWPKMAILGSPSDPKWVEYRILMNWKIKKVVAVCDETQNLNETEIFFRYQIFSIPNSILFSIPIFFWYRYRYFFRYKILRNRYQ